VADTTNIFDIHGIHRRVNTPSWATLLTFGAAAQLAKQGRRLDMATIGGHVSLHTGKTFRSSGSYNRVFAHLALLAEGSNLVFYQGTGSGVGDPLFKITHYGSLVWARLEAADWASFLLSPRSKDHAASLLVMAILQQADGLLTPLQVAQRSALTPNQALRALRALRNGLEVPDAPPGAAWAWAGAVERIGGAWQATPVIARDTALAEGVAANALTTKAPERDITEEVVSRVISDTTKALSEPETGGGDEDVDFDALLEGACPMRARLAPKPVPRPALVTLASASPTLWGPLSASPEPPSLTPEGLDPEEIPEDLLPEEAPSMFHIETQYEVVLEAEARHLKLSGGHAAALSYYLNQEWLPKLAADQEAREEAALERARLRHVQEQIDLDASLEILRQESIRIKELHLELVQVQAAHERRTALADKSQRNLTARIEAEAGVTPKSSVEVPEISYTADKYR
jgi:hypothetical protein